jgi:hypothetical protein
VAARRVGLGRDAGPGTRGGIVGLARVQPPVRAVAPTGRLRRGRRGVAHPALGQEPPSLPDAVAAEQLGEARPVARRHEHEGGADEAPGRIGLEERARHVGRVEEPLIRVAHHRSEVAVEVVPHDARDDVRGAARVGPAALGRPGEREGGRERSGVRHREEHARDVVHGAVGLVEGEPARLTQQLVEGDRAARVPGLAPLGHRRRRVYVEMPIHHERADERHGHTLRHRPGEEPRLGVDAGGIPLGHEASVLGDDNGLRLPQRPRRAGLFEGACDGVAHGGRRLADGPGIPTRPGCCGIRLRSFRQRPVRRLRRRAAGQQRAAEAGAKHGAHAHYAAENAGLGSPSVHLDAERRPERRHLRGHVAVNERAVVVREVREGAGDLGGVARANVHGDPEPAHPGAEGGEHDPREHETTHCRQLATSAAGLPRLRARLPLPRTHD